MSERKDDGKRKGRKRDEYNRYVVRRIGYWIQDPDGKPGEKIFVEKLPPDQEAALGNLVFESLRPLLLKRIVEYLKFAQLEPSDFSDEEWARLVLVTRELVFAPKGSTRAEEEMGKLSDVLKEVLTKKLVAKEAKEKPRLEQEE